MEFRTIRQTSHIDGTNRNPGITEHNKSLVWDNDIQKFKYILYTNLGINTKTNSGYVYDGNSAEAAEYIWKLDLNKNPLWRKEEYLKTIAKSTVGSSAIFTMNGGSTKLLSLGALAWLDSTPTTLLLPGNTKLLFDDNNTIGGDSSVTFDKVNKLINLTSFTGIQVKNNADIVYKGVLQYFGNKNLVLGHGSTKQLSWATNLSNNILIGENAGDTLSTGQNNVIIGHLAGANVSNNVSGSIYVGNYAGRLESTNNRFYLGNTDYSTLANAKLGSLLYGEIDNGFLRVNNRLEVSNELRIGTFNVLNTPNWGMLQFIGTGVLNEYKPQYYDGFLWRNFASGANYYLNTVTKLTADVGTISDNYKLTFDMIGLPDFTLQLGSNAFNSTIIPQASPDITSGIIQISSGNNLDSNRGFTSNSGLLWNNGNTELNVPGAIKLLTKAKYTTTGNVIISDGVHYYGKIGADWIQLDNEVTTGQANQLRYDGSITAFNLSLPKDGLYLPIKGIKSADSRLVITDNLINSDLDLSINLSVNASNYTVITTTPTSANVFNIVDNISGINPTIRFRPLISSDNSVRFTTTTNNEINISATGVGNPNIYTLTNIGTGAILKDTVTSDLTNWKLKSIIGGKHLIATQNPNDITLNVDDLTIDSLGLGIFLLNTNPTNSFNLSQRTFINGIATTVNSNGNTIQFDVNKAIPYIGWSPVPGWTAGNVAGQGRVEWKSNFKSDIRTSSTITGPTDIAVLNIGQGLYYDYVTNTLTSLNSSASNSDYRLTAWSRQVNDLILNVADLVGSGIPYGVDIPLGALAWLNEVVVPKATYTDNILPKIGGVLINKSIISAPLGNRNSFILNESTGELGFNLDPVLYSAQWNLHDVDSVTKRGFARDNIQASYINGNNGENFNSALSTCNQLTVTTSAHIGNVDVSSNVISSDSTQSSIVLNKSLGGHSGSMVVVGAGNIDMYSNIDAGSGNINFYSKTDLTVTRIAYLDSTGNLHIKGDVFAFDTTV